MNNKQTEVEEVISKETEKELDEKLDEIRADIKDYILEPDPLERMEKWVLIQKKIKVAKSLV